MTIKYGHAQRVSSILLSFVVPFLPLQCRLACPDRTTLFSLSNYQSLLSREIHNNLCNFTQEVDYDGTNLSTLAPRNNSQQRGAVQNSQTFVNTQV